MAADTSPPRIQPIIITAFVAVSVLIGLKFVFDSYYIEMFEAEEYIKIGSVQPKALLALHAAEAKSLAGAPIPIDRAIALVSRGRGDSIPGVATDFITPQLSADTASLVGWAQAERVVPVGTLSAAASASAGPSAPAGSGAPAGSAAPAGSGAPAASGAPATSAAPSGSAAPMPSAGNAPKGPASTAPSAPSSSTAPPSPAPH